DVPSFEDDSAYWTSVSFSLKTANAVVRTVDGIQESFRSMEEFMNRVFCFSAAMWMMTAALPSLAQQAPVRIVGLVELSGTGATSGTNFDNGVKLAVKEINATGGILGRKVEYTSSDAQSAPQTAKALAQKAVDEGAYVVMGP